MRTLIIVSGPPGAGKTTLARPLADRLSLPLIDKDTIKEALFEGLGHGDLEWSRKLSRTSFAVMMTIAKDLDAVVLEGNFGPEQTDALRMLHPRPIEIFCRCPTEELVRRIQARKRHPGHLDEETSRAVAEGVPSDQPLRLGGPLIEVDTTTATDHDELAQRVVSAMAGRSA